jgi:hypothetical protein
MQFIKLLAGLAIVGALVACGAGGGNPGTTPGNTSTSAATGAGTSTVTVTVTGTPTITSLVAAVSIRSSTSQIRSDGSSIATIVVNTIDASNGSLANAPVSLNASSGVLSASSGTTDANGLATFTFSSGVTDSSNRVATITATSNGKTAQTAVKIVGGTVSLDGGGVNTLLVGGSVATLSATVRDATGAVASGVPVTFESSNPSIIVVSTKTATTNGSGIASVSVSAASAGSATISASANGITSVFGFTSSASGSGFYISSPANGVVITTGTPQPVTVVAAGVGAVTFVTPLGTFANGSQVQTVAVVGGVASVVLTSNSAGTANITAYDPTATALRTANTAIVISPPVSSANKILLTASKTNVSISSATTQNAIQIKARAIFNSGGTDVGVFNVPILFSISGGPGAGEALSQAVAFTDASGNAATNFIAGTQGTTQNGVKVHAQILNSAVGTGLLPSNADLVLTIGGQALSVIFTAGTTIVPSADNTFYDLPMSAQVTDSNGNAVGNEVVSLSLKPYAFTTGQNACAPFNAFTYCSEDGNSNGSLDSSEDGIRREIPNNLSSLVCGISSNTFGSSDGLLTPPNASAGSVPGTITTNSEGVASFKLTYLKGNARWVVVKLTATVGSSGTESSYSSIFRLTPAAPDVSDPAKCPLPDSPFVY